MRIFSIILASVAMTVPFSLAAQELTDAEKVSASQDGSSPLSFSTAGKDIDDIVPGDFCDEHECNVRDGLPNFFSKANSGGDVTVAFLGGSITQGNYCYRLQICRYMEKKWPQTRFHWINAGVSGTGTDLGAFRMDEHVLRFSPDLIFVEFAVNGGYDEGMEGIIRKTFIDDPNTDICLLYSFSGNMKEDYLEGREPDVIARLEKVADHYGVPSVSLGMEASRLEADGRLVWKGDIRDKDGRIVFSSDGLHPSRQGGNLYASAIARGLEKMSAGSDAAVHHIPSEPLFGTAWDRAGMYIPSDIAGYDGNWKEIRTVDRPDFRKFREWFDVLLTSGKKESYFYFAFEGDMFGFFDIGGPEAGQLEIIVDGELMRLKPCADSGFGYFLANDAEGGYTLDRFNRWCNNRYRGQYAVVKVPYGMHQVTVRISDLDSDKKSILQEKEDITAHPDRYAKTDIYLGRILLRGEPAPIHRVKGVPLLRQQLKWDQKLERFREQDAKNPPADSLILFVGSSTMENWKTLAADFPDKDVLNRGMSGTKTIDMINYIEYLVTPYNPKQIFLYLGDNDIGYQWTPDEIMEQVKKMFFLVRREKPSAEIVLMSIKPAPVRMKHIERIVRTNSMIKEFAESQSNTRYADVFGAMIGASGQVDPECYREDGLHLTAKGYGIWKEVVSKYIK